MQNKFDLQVSIGQIYIRPSGFASFKNILVLDHHGDTLLAADTIKLKIGDLNFSKNTLIEFKKAYVAGAYFRMVTYKGEAESNLNIVLNKFKPKKKNKTKKKSDFTLQIRQLTLINSKFSLINHNVEPPNMAFEPSNMNITAINGKIRAFQVQGSDIIMDVIALSAKEKSGLTLKNLTASVIIAKSQLAFNALDLKTSNSHLSGTFAMLYDGFKDFQYFLDSVRFETNLGISNISSKDIAFFVDKLKDMDYSIRFRGDLHGPVSNLYGNNINIYFGSLSQFDGSVRLIGLPNIDSTYINFNLEKLTTNAYDIAHIPLPPFGEKNHLKIPSEVAQLGVLTFTGGFLGTINNFTAKGNLYTSSGHIHTDINMRNLASGVPKYSGQLRLDKVLAGKIIQNKELLGEVSLSANLKGSGLTLATLNTHLDGVIEHATVNGYTYHNIDIAGSFVNKSFNGTVAIADSNINLSFDGNINLVPEKPYFNFKANFKDINLTALNLQQTDSGKTAKISGNIHALFSGVKLSNISGTILSDSIMYTLGDETYKLKNFTFNASTADSNKKTIKVRSSLVDIDLNGRFRIASLINDIKNRLNSVMPSLNFKVNKKLPVANADFSFSLYLKEINNFTNLFSDKLYIADNAYIIGRYNINRNQLYIKSYVKEIDYGSINLRPFKLQANNQNGALAFKLTSNNLHLTDSIFVENAGVNITLSSDSLQFKILWKNPSYQLLQNRIAGTTYLGDTNALDINFNNTQVYYFDKRWHLDDKAAITYLDKGIKAKHFSLYNSLNQTVFSIKGQAIKGNSKPLQIALNKFPLRITSLFLPASVSLSGYASGSVDLYKLYKKPHFTSRLLFDSLAFNNILLGQLKVNSFYKSQKNKIVLNTELKKGGKINFSIKEGSITPFGKKENFNITAILQNFNLKPFAKLAEPTITGLQGYLRGQINLSGTFKNPQLRAKINGSDLAMGIGFLENYFYLYPKSDIIILDKSITLTNLVVQDEDKNSAIINGYFRHDFFTDFSMNLSLSDIESLKIMDTELADGNAFYGTIFASGNANISGTFSDLKVSAHVTTEENTELNIPISSSKSASQAGFVKFVSAETKTDSALTEQEKNKNNFTLDLYANVTPGAEFNIIFDQNVGDAISAQGKGQIYMHIDGKNNFVMRGNYEIVRGSYLFTLQNILSKRFDIQKGSSILWTGNPYEAYLDITAVYKTRASVFPIMAAFDPINAERYRQPVNVHCLLMVSNKLSNPYIDFGIRMPYAEEIVKAQVSSVISTEEEKSRQVFSLLILNQFIPPESIGVVGGGSGVAAGKIVGASGVEFLSSQLNNWLSDFTNKVNVNVRYVTGQALARDQLNVGLSTRLFNNRVVIRGDVGVGVGENSSSVSQNNVVGNANIEVKLTKDGHLRLNVFNRSNQGDILNNFVPYTQGVGLSYTITFDKFGDLFRKSEKQKSKYIKPDIDTTLTDSVKMDTLSWDTTKQDTMSNLIKSKDKEKATSTGGLKKQKNNASKQLTTIKTDNALKPKGENEIKEVK